jgi:hypothetical protein
MLQNLIYFSAFYWVLKSLFLEKPFSFYQFLFLNSVKNSPSHLSLSANPGPPVGASLLVEPDQRATRGRLVKYVRKGPHRVVVAMATLRGSSHTYMSRSQARLSFFSDEWSMWILVFSHVKNVWDWRIQNYSLRPILFFANTNVSITKMCLDTSILAKSIMDQME